MDRSTKATLESRTNVLINFSWIDNTSRKQGVDIALIYVVIVCFAAEKNTIFRKQGASIPGKTNRGTRDESQWIVAQRLLSTLTIPGFS